MQRESRRRKERLKRKTARVARWSRPVSRHALDEKCTNNGKNGPTGNNRNDSNNGNHSNRSNSNHNKNSIVSG